MRTIFHQFTKCIKTMKRTYILLFGIFCVIAAAVSGCSKEKQAELKVDSTASGQTVQHTTPKAPEKIFSVQATVTEVDREKNRLFIDHEKMEGYMEAMEMPFKVNDPAVFDKVKVGTKGKFTIEVTDGVGAITDVTVDAQ